MRIVESPQDLKFSFDFLEDAKLADFLLVEYFDGNFMASLLVECHSDLTKGTITQILRESVLSYSDFVYRHFSKESLRLKIFYKLLKNKLY